MDLESNFALEEIGLHRKDGKSYHLYVSPRTEEPGVCFPTPQPFHDPWANYLAWPRFSPLTTIADLFITKGPIAATWSSSMVIISLDLCV